MSTVVKQVGTATPTMMSYGSDASGNTTVRPVQTLAYNASGKLSKTTVGATTQKNVYDASGALLMRIDTAAGATLYLGETELNQAAGSSIVTGVRTYNANGVSIAERTSQSGGSSTTLNWLSADLVNTAVMKIDALTGAITRRYMDPFGNARGAGAAWSSNHGYLNAPTSAVTGLTHLGAREYDPVLGRFISVDAVLAPGNPQQNNGYSYAGNNPITRSDPSGNCYMGNNGDHYYPGECDKGTTDGGTENHHTTPTAAGNSTPNVRVSNNCGYDSHCYSPSYAKNHTADLVSYEGGMAVMAANPVGKNPGLYAGRVLDGVAAVSAPLLATCMADFAQPLCWGGALGEGVGVLRAGLVGEGVADVGAVSTSTELLAVEEVAGKIPQEAWDVLPRVDAGIPAPAGMKGGRAWANRDGLLPDGANYKEWDVNPRIPGQGRDSHRVVTGDDQSAWYTSDHYESFWRMR
ncbi:hypothetical protein E3O44_10895 [Cryobacterium algoricola]|uniref:Uncharacterized protein n=1 Tax=Cryobacterium algoricola TaxID=1259183 RepID=A0ABY2IDB0_9MICO|nr:ribonuclease domain-containing protein [Cryobacterium algoricola]TFB87590.1 hypothetical protein E3O44_10895 [Cryobacterium algoricola]